MEKQLREFRESMNDFSLFAKNLDLEVSCWCKGTYVPKPYDEKEDTH